jgi:hypothetical protein
MPFTYSFAKTLPRVVVLRARGEASVVLWATAMRYIIADGAFRQTTPILLDVTDALGAPTSEEVVVIAQVWRLLTPRSRGAIVAPDAEQLRVAMQIEQLSEGRVRAFTDAQAAVEWLDPMAARKAAVH